MTYICARRPWVVAARVSPFGRGDPLGRPHSGVRRRRRVRANLAWLEPASASCLKMDGWVSFGLFVVVVAVVTDKEMRIITNR